MVVLMVVFYSLKDYNPIDKAKLVYLLFAYHQTSEEEMNRSRGNSVKKIKELFSQQSISSNSPPSWKSKQKVKNTKTNTYPKINPTTRKEKIWPDTGTEDMNQSRKKGSRPKFASKNPDFVDQKQGNPVQHTCVLIGTSQSGKSTFVNYILEQNLGPGSSKKAKEGTNNQACTTTCTTYSLPKYRAFAFPRCPTTFENLEDRKRFVTTPHEKYHEGKTEWKSNLTLIDTPGLDDSKGEAEDEKIVVKILQTLKRAGKLSCVIFVVKFDKPFSNSFQKHFEYYRKMLPAMKNNFVIVHTKCSMLEAGFDPGAIAERKKVFKKVFKDASASHVFIELKPGPDNVFNPFYQYKKLLAQQTLHCLLAMLDSYSAIETTEIKYVKSARVLASDKRLLQRIDGLLQGMRETLQTIESQYSDGIENYQSVQGLFEEKSTTTMQKKRRLEQLDSEDDYFLAERSVEKGWMGTFFSDPAITYESPTFPIKKVSKDCASGRTWEVIKNTEKKWKGRLISEWYSGSKGSVKFWTWMKLGHADEIKRLRTEYDKAEENLAKLKVSMLTLQKQKSENDHKKSALERKIAVSTALKIELADDRMPIATYLAVRKLYALEVNDQTHESMISLANGICSAFNLETGLIC